MINMLSIVTDKQNITDEQCKQRETILKKKKKKHPHTHQKEMLEIKRKIL